MKKNYNIVGLTLLELVIVITIIAILAGTITPIYYNVTNSKLAEYTKDEMERIKAALIEFYRDCDQFPKDSGNVTTDFLDLERQPASSRFYGSASLQNWRRSQWNGPYIQDKFNDNGYMKDGWNNNYIYNYTYGDNYCEVISYGPDRASGGGDDITIRADIITVREDKIERVKDELDIIQKALNDYIKATGNVPSSIDDLFGWEVLNLHMDESLWNGTPDEVRDYSGMGSHGTAYYDATTTSSGKVGRAGIFDGSGDYVKVNNVSVDTTAGSKKNTVEFWMYWTGGNNQMPFGWNTSYDLWLYNNAFGFNTGNGNIEGISGTSFLQNSWHHIVAVFPNGAPNNSNAELWIDGEQRTITHQFGGGPGSRTVTPTVFISGWGVSSGYKFGGRIDELRIYRGTLSAEEIHRHYENPGYPKDYFDLHDYSFKYDEWEDVYHLGSTIVNGNTVYYFYSYGPDRANDSGGGDDIKPRGL